MPNWNELFTLKTYTPHVLDAFRMLFLLVSAYVLMVFAERAMVAAKSNTPLPHI